MHLALLLMTLSAAPRLPAHEIEKRMDAFVDSWAGALLSQALSALGKPADAYPTPVDNVERYLSTFRWEPSKGCAFWFDTDRTELILDTHWKGDCAEFVSTLPQASPQPSPKKRAEARR